MRNYILADNQELTSFALQSMLENEDGNYICSAKNKTGLMSLLKEHEETVVILDYKLFDFADEEQLLIVGDRFAKTAWVLISDELTEKFLRSVVYSSHSFSVVFKDEPIKEISDAVRSALEGKRFISHRAIEMILAQRHTRAIAWK